MVRLSISLLLTVLSSLPSLLRAAADDRAQLVYWGGGVTMDGRNFNKPWIQVSLGRQHAVGLKSDRTVVAWGRNDHQQAEVPNGLSNVKAVAAGQYHSVALKNDGTLVAWGNNDYEQLLVPSGNYKAISAGWSHTLAIENDGTVVAWGNGEEGQTSVPDGLANVAAIAAGEAHSVALLTNGAVVAWGRSSHGLLNVPTAALSGVKAIAAGGNHIVALKTDGTVVAWGKNDYQQTEVPEFYGTTVKAIAAGENHTVVLRSDGNASGYGRDDSGQAVQVAVGKVISIFAGYDATLTQGLDGAFSTWGSHYPGFSNEVKAISGKTVLKTAGAGMAWGDGPPPPEEVQESSRIIAIASGLGAYHSLALRDDGTVVAWGENGSQQSTVPPALGPVKAIAAGRYHTVVLQTNGAVVAWGENSSGQTTVPAAALSDIKAIAAGSDHTVALRNNGTVIAWGSNNYGETQVPAGLSNVQAIAAGDAHTVALKSDGTVIAWGNNVYDQVTVPVGLTGVKAIAAGDYHTVALKNDGSVVAWGSNDEGQLNIPAGLSGAEAIAAGRDFTATITSLPASSPKAPTVTITTGSVGQSFALIATAQGTGPFTYQWRKDGKPIAGATKSILTLTSAQLAQRAAYDVIVKNAFGAALPPYPLSFGYSPLASSMIYIVGGGLFNSGQTVRLQAWSMYGGIPAGTKWQWYKENMLIKGATTTTLTISNANVSSAGRYSIVITPPSGSALTLSAYLRINDTGLLIYKMAGTGNAYYNSVSPTASTGAITGYVILDRARQRGGFVLGRKNGSVDTHSLELHEELKTQSTGPVPKTQTVVSEAAIGEPVIWLNGTDSLLSVSKTDQTFGPATLKGFMNYSRPNSTDPQLTDYVETMSLTLTLDASNSVLARIHQETVEQAMLRISKALQLKGSVLIE